jgi:hypothetical protein
MKLRWLLSVVLAVIMLVALAGLGAMFQIGLRAYSAATAVEAVNVRTEALSASLSRALYEEWRRVESTAARLTGKVGPGLNEETIAALEVDVDKISWVGIANRSGTVLAASGGMLVGESVAQRPWFQEGLVAPFAGDVHEAVLLARLLESSDAEPLRFVDFSAPIFDADGRVSGVLGAHINWRWVRQLVDEAAARLGLDVFLVNRSGTVLLGTADVDEDLSELGSFRAAQMGRSTTNTEIWPDGRTYFTTTIPEIRYETLPPFGWSIVARLDPVFLQSAENAFRNRMLLGALALLLVAVGGFAVVAAILLRPLQVVADNLLQLGRGEPTPFVREHRRFHEATMLSNALALLQSRLDNGKDKKS